MHRALELSLGVAALAVTVGLFCVGAYLIFALLIDLTSNSVTAVLILLLIALSAAGIVIAANRRSYPAGTQHITIMTDLGRASVVLLMVTLIGALVSFFITIALITLAKHHVFPDRLGNALLQLRELRGDKCIGVAVFMVLQAGWILPLLAQIRRGGLRRLPVALRLSYTWMLYVVPASAVSLLLVFLLGPL